MKHDVDPARLFEVFKEIGIIEQLSRTRLEARLPEGLIAPHFAVLSHLINRGDGAVPIDMARAFQVPKTSMTHTIKGLVKHGFVELRANADDGRSKRVWLTDKGRAFRDTTMRAVGGDIMEMAQDFNVGRLMEILPVLTDLRIWMDAERDKREKG